MRRDCPPCSVALRSHTLIPWRGEKHAESPPFRRLSLLQHRDPVKHTPYMQQRWALCPHVQASGMARLRTRNITVSDIVLGGAQPPLIRIRGSAPFWLGGFHVDAGLRRGMSCWRPVWVGGVCRALPGAEMQDLTRVSQLHQAKKHLIADTVYEAEGEIKVVYLVARSHAYPHLITSTHRYIICCDWIQSCLEYLFGSSDVQLSGSPEVVFGH